MKMTHFNHVSHFLYASVHPVKNFKKTVTHAKILMNVSESPRSAVLENQGIAKITTEATTVFATLDTNKNLSKDKRVAKTSTNVKNTKEFVDVLNTQILMGNFRLNQSETVQIFQEGTLATVN